MLPQPRVVIEAKPENPGRIVVIDAAARERHLPLSPLAPSELTGLVDELRARGCQVEAHEADVEAQVPAYSAEAALDALGLAPPYRALEAAVAAQPPGSDAAPS